MSRIFRLVVASIIALIGLAGPMQDAGAQGAGTGTVTVLKYYCTYIEQTMQVEAIDMNQCSPGAATFTFYLVGDGTDDYQQLNVGDSGEGTIELPAGQYEVVEEGSQTHFMVNVSEGGNVQLLVANPAGNGVATGTVTVLKYYCTYIEQTMQVEAIEMDQCASGAATFTFYLVGDGTDDYQQLNVGANGQGSIELPVGQYEVVEEGSQSRFMVNVLEGESAHLLIANPAAEVVATEPAPVPTTAPAPTTVPAQQAAAPAPALKLPNTGSGAGSGTGMLMLAATAAAALAGSSAMIVRRVRND